VRKASRRKLHRLLESARLLPDTHTTPYPDKWNLSQAERYFLKTCYVAAGQGVALRRNERQILRWKNAYHDRRCFIIGNGPSLRNTDLDLLRDEITIGVNSIFLSGFLPTHYVVEDIFVAEDRAAEIKALKGPTKWFGNHLKYCFDDDSACWLNLRMRYNVEDPDFPTFSTNAARQVWASGTVSYICMQLAYFFGCPSIYLVGFDHHYDIPSDAEKEGNMITSASDDPNHFDPSYFGKGYRWHDPMVERMERGYVAARKNFELAGRQIINATVGGKLEVFPRVNFESLFTGRGK